MKRFLKASIGLAAMAAPAALAASATDQIELAMLTPRPQDAAAQKMFADRVLVAHNQERLTRGVAPLAWSDQLAADAAFWARHLAATNSFDHAPRQAGKAPQGENLWMGTRFAYAPEDMVGMWIDEKAIFKRGKFPAISTTPDWRDAAHYTQLIWSTTTHVGCALSANQQDEFLVCRYGPAGNWKGEDPLNAIPKNGGGPGIVR